MADEPKVKGGGRTKGRAAVEKKAVALTRLAVEYVATDSVTPNAYNPNRQDKHDFELLLRSMREDGFTQPIVVQGDTMTIVDGEHRWRAAQELGLKEIPVVKVAMTPEQMRIATLRHNRARGSEDVELTADVLRDLRELGALDWAQDSLMMDETEMNRLLDDIKAPEGLAEDLVSEAWEPRQIEPTSVAPVEEQGADGQRRATALSAAAVEAQRERERRMKEAKNEEERAQVRKESAIYRVVLIFADEEAELVRGVLGEAPAETLLRLCRQERAAAPQEVSGAAAS